MNLLDNITRIEEAKQAIKEAIIAKGVKVNSDEHLDTYADKINSITASSGSNSIITTKSFKMLTNITYASTKTIKMDYIITSNFEEIIEEES